MSCEGALEDTLSEASIPIGGIDQGLESLDHTASPDTLAPEIVTQRSKRKGRKGIVKKISSTPPEPVAAEEFAIPVEPAKSFENLVNIISAKARERTERLEVVCNEIFGILKQKSRYKMAKCIVSKLEPKCVLFVDETIDSATGVPSISLSEILNDFEQCLKSPLTDEDRLNKNTVEAVQLDCIAKSNRYTLKLICDGCQVELIPALTFALESSTSLQERQMVVLEGLAKHWDPESESVTGLSEDLHQLYENSLLEGHYAFLNGQSQFVQKMVLLAKFWDASGIWLDSHVNSISLACDEMLELLAINAAQREETSASAGKESEETPSYLRGFRKYMISLHLFEKLRVNMYSTDSLKVIATQYKGENGTELLDKVASALATFQQGPYFIISPNNPFKNLVCLEEEYLASKMIHGIMTFEMTQRIGPNMVVVHPNHVGFELLSIILPYMLVNSKPTFVKALRALVEEMERVGLTPGIPDHYDLPAFAKAAIESGQLHLEEEDGVAVVCPSTLCETFKAFKLDQPPRELEPLLVGLQEFDKFAQPEGTEEFCNQLIIYEFISRIGAFPKIGYISIEMRSEEQGGEKGETELQDWLMKQFNCTRVGFNIRSRTKFEAASEMGSIFLPILAQNVDMNIQGLCAGCETYGRFVEAEEMEHHLQGHILQFMNPRGEGLIMIECDVRVRGKAKKVKKGQGRRFKNDCNTNQHESFDLTYVTKYEVKTESSIAHFYAAISINW